MGKGKFAKRNAEKHADKSNIVLHVFMHCEGCSDKVYKCLRSFNGVEKVDIDRANNEVIVKGEAADPIKILEMLRKKYSKNVELISPNPKEYENKQKSQRKQTEKKEEVQVKIVTLKMYIHCEGCSNDIRSCIQKMEGVQSVELDEEESQVKVKGTIEPSKIIQHVKKRLGKHAEIIKHEGIKGDSKGDSKNSMGNINNKDNIILFSYPSQYSTQYLYPNQTFSDENVNSCSIM